MKKLISIVCASVVSIGPITLPSAASPGNLSVAATTVALPAPPALVAFSPLFPLVDTDTMAATNGLDAFLNIEGLPLPQQSGSSLLREPPLCAVSIFNHSTNTIGCLTLGQTRLCSIALFDSNGNAVEKTEFGKSFGGTLSQESIERWRHHDLNRHTSMFLKIVPNALPRYRDLPTAAGIFGITDAFRVKHPGQYEVHVQVRVVQIGQDSHGKIYYPITVLHDVKAKVQIGTGQILSTVGK